MPWPILFGLPTGPPTGQHGVAQKDTSYSRCFFFYLLIWWEGLIGTGFSVVEKVSNPLFLSLFTRLEKKIMVDWFFLFFFLIFGQRGTAASTSYGIYIFSFWFSFSNLLGRALIMTLYSCRGVCVFG